MSGSLEGFRVKSVRFGLSLCPDCGRVTETGDGTFFDHATVPFGKVLCPGSGKGAT